MFQEPSETRQLRVAVAQHQDVLALLIASRRSLRRMGHDTRAIDSEIDRISSLIGRLHAKAEGRVEPRNRPRFDESPAHQANRSTLYVFLDESGVRSPNVQESFSVFVVGAAIIEATYFEEVVKPAADRLKLKYFGTKDITFHEPALRHHDSGFSFGQDVDRQQEFCSAYRTFLSGLEIDFVAALLDKGRLRDVFGDGPVDDYLPGNQYALAYDFVLERVCNLLHFERRDGIGAIFPERCGKREDAELQLEHARLVTEGTRYVPAKWFQHQFRPGLRFYRKGEHFGIELADVLARTVADHYRVGSEAACWSELGPKLFNGHMDRISPGDRWGMYKVFPTSTPHDADEP